MNATKRPVNNHDHYHAHVYFDAQTLTFAQQLCIKAGELFALKIGTVHQKKVGPHLHWSCQILFSSQHFERLITWLEKHRGELTIFIHAQTGNDLKDHTDYAYWLGQEADLKLAVFSS